MTTVNPMIAQQPRNNFGQVLMTKAVGTTSAADFVMEALDRHFSNDWGDLSEEDAQMNAEAIQERNGGQIMSAYKNMVNGEDDLWVITVGFGDDPSDPERCHTTVMLPSDY